MFPFFLIAIIFGVATGTLVEVNYCDKRDAEAVKLGQPAPSGDRLCDLVERDRRQLRER